jgi:16S rRNA (guanine(966)-N(2))-methyltransferase RsmD
MRVVAGAARGRTLVVPTGRDVRPTADRVREAAFNALWSMGVLDGAAVLDLFAGSGALAIEALSRGAASAVLVEHAAGARAAIAHNLATTDLAGEASVVPADASRYLAQAARRGERFDLVLCDPPYAFEGWPELFEELEPVLAPEGLVVVEAAAPVEAPEWAEVTRTKRYGGTVLTMLRRRTGET